MKNFTSTSKKGFTLIELLIVIALLGALAVGLLAAVDPFEQLKKGTDTSLSNMVSEIYNAAIRHYANTSSTPWGTGTVTYSSLWEAGGSTMLSSIISGGELKPDFMTLAGSGKLSKISFKGVEGPGTINVQVCFAPESKSYNKNKNTKYTDQYGDTPDDAGTTCKYGTGSTQCYWCVK